MHRREPEPSGSGSRRFQRETNDGVQLGGPGVRSVSADEARSPRLRRVRKVQSDAERAGKVEPLYNFWVRSMTEVGFRLRATVIPQRTMFNANVRMMKDDEGITDTELRTMITTFASQVAAGAVRIDGKDAWRVFVARRAKLAHQDRSAVRDEHTRTGDDYRL